MRALLFCSVDPAEFQVIGKHSPPCLLSVGDIPILIHIIERLVDEGIREFTIVSHDWLQMIEQVLGNGERWGASIDYQLVRDRAAPFNEMRSIAASWNDVPILVGRAECLPGLASLVASEHSPGLWVERTGDWTGWAVVDKEHLECIEPATSWQELPGVWSDLPQNIVATQLSTESVEAWMSSNRTVLLLQEENPWLPTTACQFAPGVWVSQGASVDPSAELVAPVYIGKDSQIEADCKVGPNVIVEHQSLIDKGSHLSDTLVCHDSYVGQNLTLESSIVSRNLLLNFAMNSVLQVSDEFIISGLSPKSPWRSITRGIERGIAAVALLLLSPLLLFQLLRYQLKVQEVVRLPAEDGSGPWLTQSWFFFSLKQDIPYLPCRSLRSQLPALLKIVRGEASFVGVLPRTEKEVAALPEDWQHLYLKSKIGWLTWRIGTQFRLVMKTFILQMPSMRVTQAHGSIFVASSAICGMGALRIRLKIIATRNQSP